MKKLLLILFTLGQLTVFSQKNMNFLGNLAYNQKINDIWGYTDSNNNEYALVGGTTMTSIVSVTDPNNPIELFRIEGDTSIWRDIKTFNEFAYVTNETGGGLLIIDLSDLPNSIDYQRWTVGTYDYQKAHNIFIDENGIAHIFGSNIKNQGDFMLDLNFSNRFEPPYYGIYDDRYCHDGYVKNNILWTSEIYQGDFSVVDISNPTNTTIISRQQTSTNFTHQCWLSDDNNYLITTDEKPGAFVDIYDVSDINNIELLDKYQSSPDDNVIPHNSFFLGNDYFFNSYYRDGITLVDATRKTNLVEVGNYDTSPFPSDEGFQGSWGVYPYLPSGNILASDREEGLFIVSVNYQRACYLEGSIIDTSSFLPINDVKVEIVGSKQIKHSKFDGSYAIGIVDSGFYDIRFSLPHCQTIIVSGIELKKGIVTNLDVETNCNFPVAINNIHKDKTYSISPNPFKNNFSIQFDSEELLKRVEIYNTTGQLMKNIEVGVVKGNLIVYNKWNSGMYFVKMFFENHIYSEIILCKY